MCGIAGIVDFDGRPIDISLLESMTNVLAHRGPDGEGYVLLSSIPSMKPLSCTGPLHAAVRAVPHVYTIGFGHRRLAILDVSPLGHQPMASEDGRAWISYNGEIYNSPELRIDLEKAGWHFRSTTDTEVLLAAYQQWGIDCLIRLNGMFAFAIWDEARKRLFCARDRMGIKPFYYSQRGGRLLFGSEIKALLGGTESLSAPNTASIYDFLSFGLQDHSEETFFTDIHQLRPAHYLLFERGALSVRPWWAIEHAPKEPERAPADYGERFRELLEDAVRIHLRSDRAVGSSLSGGLDSSTIVCLAHDLLNAGKASRAAWATTPRLQSFSACFEDPDCDERMYLQAAVERADTQSHEIYPDGLALFEQLPKVLWHQDEPFSGASYLAQWAVMQAASQRGVKVLLDGQGGDELLCGYPGYWGSYFGELVFTGQWGTLLQEFRRLMAGSQPVHSTVYANIAKWLLPTAAMARIRATLKGHHSWMGQDFARLYAERSKVLGYPKGAMSPLDNHISAYLSTHSLPALLHHEDRSSMAFSVEARLPFLDTRVVEFLLRLPNQYKLRQGLTKAVLRDAMAGVLPRVIRERTDKKGFATPQDRWLRTTLRPAVEDIFHSQAFRQRGYWDPQRLGVEYQGYCGGRHSDMGTSFWRCLTLELWHERFFS